MSYTTFAYLVAVTQRSEVDLDAQFGKYVGSKNKNKDRKTIKKNHKDNLMSRSWNQNGGTTSRDGGSIGSG